MVGDDVKPGDRVVYAIGSVEYEAVALGEPHFGLCGAIRGATLSLNLIYLNEQGTPVKIYAAPLLSAAGDEAYQKSVAQEAAYRELDWKLADAEKRAEIVAEKLAQVKANPRTIGWRPDTNRVEVAQLKAIIASLEQDFSILNEAFSGYVEAHPPIEDQPTPAPVATTTAASSDSAEQSASDTSSSTATAPQTVDTQQNQASAPSVTEKQVNATAGQEPDATTAEGAIPDGGSPTN